MNVYPMEIEVIASFDKDGSIRPLRIRIKDDSGENIVLNVDQIIQVDHEKFAGNIMIRYKCKSIVGNLERCYDLKFERDTYKWYLFSMS